MGGVFFFKQKTAYEIYQCDWSSDVCSSDLPLPDDFHGDRAVEEVRKYLTGEKDSPQIEVIYRAMVMFEDTVSLPSEPVFPCQNIGVDKNRKTN